MKQGSKKASKEGRKEGRNVVLSGDQHAREGGEGSKDRPPDPSAVVALRGNEDRQSKNNDKNFTS
jgi:hypothetical protein